MFFLSRVGESGKTGTRFLTYVDAVLGFKHLLTESDLDKALSMCSSLRGKLRSRFLVLSDDHTSPPPRHQTVARGLWTKKRKTSRQSEINLYQGPLVIQSLVFLRLAGVPVSRRRLCQQKDQLPIDLQRRLCLFRLLNHHQWRRSLRVRILPRIGLHHIQMKSLLKKQV